MERIASFISSGEKGRTREAAYEESREVDSTRSARWRLSKARTGVPNNF
jgi:hypothetical protein